jgi:hypothetical protein
MKVKKFNDERIQKKMEQIAASMYPVLLILITVVLAIKIAFNLYPLLYLFEIIALTSLTTHYIISTARKNVLFVKETDEAIINIRRSIKYRCCELHFYISIVQLFFYAIAIYYFPHWFSSDKQTFFVIIIPFIYLFIWVMPFSIAGNKMKKQGDLHSMWWSSEKSKTLALKRLKKWAILNFILQSIIAVAFGLLSKSWFYPIYHLVVVNTLWIAIYFIIKRNLLASEKKAKELELTEKSVNEEAECCVE